MKVALYRYYDRMKVANKMGSVYHASYGTWDATLREPCDVIDPVFTIQTATTYSGDDTTDETLPYLRANYLSMQWGSQKVRYYYILKKVVLSSSLVELHCHEDVVTTWWNVIKNSTGILSRCTVATDNEKQLIDDICDAGAPRYDSTINFTAGGHPGFIANPSSIAYCIAIGISGTRYSENGRVSTYLITESTFNLINSMLVSTNFEGILNPTSLIAFCWKFPYNFGGSLSDEKNIILNNVIIGTGIPTTNFNRSLGSDIAEFSHSYNDFRNYTPFTTYQLYLPFYGFVPLNASVLDSSPRVRIDYTLNIIDGSLLMKVTSDSALVGNYTTRIGQRMSVLASNYTELATNQQGIDIAYDNGIAMNDLNVISTAIGFGASAASLATSPSIGAAGGLGNSIVGINKDIQTYKFLDQMYQYRKTLNSNVTITSSPMTGNVSWQAPLIPRIVKYSRPTIFPTNMGYKCNRSVTPNDLTSTSLGNFAQFKYININGSDATYNEVGEITQLMQSGLYY